MLRKDERKASILLKPQRGFLLWLSSTLSHQELFKVRNSFILWYSIEPSAQVFMKTKHLKSQGIMPVPSTSSTKMAKWDQGNGPLKYIHVAKLYQINWKNRIDVKYFYKENYTISPYTFVFLSIRLLVVLFMCSLKTKLILSFKKTGSNFHNMQNSICYKGKSCESLILKITGWKDCYRNFLTASFLTCQKSETIFIWKKYPYN